jgi:hypothetical protein
MNYLVLISNLKKLNFTSISCTVTMRYSCIVVFYTLQGFQGYKICKIWFSRLISIDFTSCSQIEKNLNFV